MNPAMPAPIPISIANTGINASSGRFAARRSNGETRREPAGARLLNDDYSEYPINGGKLTLKPGCTFSGHFGLSDGYGTRTFLDSGAMGRDKIYVEGVGHDNRQGIFKFSGVKK